MRVTNSLVVDRSIRDIAAGHERLVRTQQDISTGKRIHRPSDDPTANARAMVLRRNMAENTQYRENVATAREFLHTTDTAMQSYTDAMQRLRQLAVQGANGSLRLEDKQAISKEVTQIRDELQAIGNTRHEGRYIFGGIKTNQEVYPSAPINDVTLGPNDSGAIPVEVSPGVTLPMNVPATRFYGDTVPPSTNNVFAMIDTFQGFLATGTSTRDISDITIAAIDQYISTSNAVRTDIGGRINRLDMADARYEAANLDLESMLQSTEDTDIAKATLQLNQHEATFQAALAVGARAMPTSLVDFLR